MDELLGRIKRGFPAYVCRESVGGIICATLLQGIRQGNILFSPYEAKVRPTAVQFNNPIVFCGLKVRNVVRESLRGKDIVEISWERGNPAVQVWRNGLKYWEGFFRKKAWLTAVACFEDFCFPDDLLKVLNKEYPGLLVLEPGKLVESLPYKIYWALKLILAESSPWRCLGSIKDSPFETAEELKDKIRLFLEVSKAELERFDELHASFGPVKLYFTDFDPEIGAYINALRGSGVFVVVRRGAAFISSLHGPGIDRIAEELGAEKFGNVAWAKLKGDREKIEEQIQEIALKQSTLQEFLEESKNDLQNKKQDNQ